MTKVTVIWNCFFYTKSVVIFGRGVETKNFFTLEICGPILSFKKQEILRIWKPLENLWNKYFYKSKKHE